MFGNAPTFPTLGMPSRIQSQFADDCRSRNEEARVVERSRIVLAGVAGKQLRKVARELRVSVPAGR